MQLSGLNSFAAGIILIAAARATFMAALFLLFARLSGSRGRGDRLTVPFAATAILNPFVGQQPAIVWTHQDFRIGSMTTLPEQPDEVEFSERRTGLETGRRRHIIGEGKTIRP